MNTRLVRLARSRTALGLSFLSLAACGHAGDRTPAPPQAVACADLTSLETDSAAITASAIVKAGAFTTPAQTGLPSAHLTIAADLCRVQGVIKPTAKSNIKFEVWLPASGWNGKFQMIGNGGNHGFINHAALNGAVAAGYAAAATDTGHSSDTSDASWAVNNPEALIDFGYRAVHLTALEAKAVITAHYAGAPQKSYWNGCSSGGKQGLMEAQRYPDDFDGIVSGAPANYWTHLNASHLLIALTTLSQGIGGPAYIPPAKMALLAQRSVQTCDANDGVEDGVIEDPAACKFDPAVLQCAAADAADCLTAAQVDSARKIYNYTTNPRSGEPVFPGLAPGSEAAWGTIAGGPDPFPIARNVFADQVFNNPNWDWKTFDGDTDVAYADAVLGPITNAVNPDLSAFKAHGGKLIQYHGWSDQLISPFNSIDYYTSVAARMGGKASTDDFYRLFMVPGMAHCRGGTGTETFDAVAALDQWVTKGTAPDKLDAARVVSGQTVRTRPLCPYPKTAVYRGSGSTDAAASFTCR